jgi:hypothetical protein
MKHYFRPYSNNSIFIETGTSSGDGVIAALNVGFSKIHSIEISKFYFDESKKLFRRFPNVILHFGDSTDILPKILGTINEKCTFWLDAHYCGGQAGGDFEHIVLMDELQIIANHHIKEHTILIDDMRLVRNKEAEWRKFPYTDKEIEECILQINSNYKIKYSSGVVENDILSAFI